VVENARIALGEQRAKFGPRDLPLALARDEEASRLLAGLGIDLDVLRERLDREPLAAS